MKAEYALLFQTPSLTQTVEGSAGSFWATPTLRRSASHLLWMPSIERDILHHPETPYDEAATIISRAKEQTGRKVAHLGLMLHNYFDAYEAFKRGDLHTLRDIERTAKHRVIPEDAAPDTKSQMTATSQPAELSIATSSTGCNTAYDRANFPC